MEYMKLGDIVNIRTGKLNANVADEKGSYPFFTCSKKISSISSYSYDTEAVLVAGNGDLNVKYYKGKFDAYQRTYIITDNSSNQLYMPFLYFYMSAYVAQLRNQAIGGVIKYIKLQNLTEAEIRLPSIEQQKEIVKFLQIIQGVINDKKNEMSKLDELIKARFVEMFGDPVQNSLNKPMVKLESLGDWKSGGTPARSNPNFYDGNINWFSAGELDSLYLSKSKEKITDEAVRKSSTKLFAKGSMLIGMYDTAAFKMGILKEPSCANQACANIRANEKVNVIWLYYELQAMKKYFLNQRHGVRQKNLTLKMIKQFEIPYFDLSLQNKFANFVQQVNKSKVAVQKSLEETQTLFASLMQKYFS